MTTAKSDHRPTSQTATDLQQPFPSHTDALSLFDMSVSHMPCLHGGIPGSLDSEHHGHHRQITTTKRTATQALRFSSSIRISASSSSENGRPIGAPGFSSSTVCSAWPLVGVYMLICCVGGRCTAGAPANAAECDHDVRPCTSVFVSRRHDLRILMICPCCQVLSWQHGGRC
jgi:hypothetical protein